MEGEHKQQERTQRHEVFNEHDTSNGTTAGTVPINGKSTTIGTTI
jgi:hypothetical protein